MMAEPRLATIVGKAGVAEAVAARAISAAVRAERKTVLLRERIVHLECFVSTDELTGILNRRAHERPSELSAETNAP